METKRTTTVELKEADGKYYLLIWDSVWENDYQIVEITVWKAREISRELSINIISLKPAEK